jgi:4-diphosphocytidyl-2-C-methyl-D-erythritol kinase
MFTINAPAKINLTLEIIGKRPDSYHEIRSVIQTLSFADVLRFYPAEDINITCDLPGWKAEQSLITKTVKLLQEKSGCVKGAAIKIEKHIPLMSGLGGDSSDAAAVLSGLNRLWGLKLSQLRLQEMAAKLGSDVTFFLSGGTALMEGRGEKITTLPKIPHKWVILVVPAVPAEPEKTKRLYAQITANHYTDGSITDNFMSTIKSGQSFPDALLFNTFENVVFARGEELTNYRDHMLKIGAPYVHLAGSGPTLFTMLDDKAKAADLTKKLQNYGMTAHLTETR